MTPPLAGIGPFGTTEMLVIAALVGGPVLVLGGIIFLVVYLSKKQK
ncbi:hypothetical protein DES53_109120 [Roseimicrobium gellanilyticum]|uniref:Uncharacterized protein n=1 Tax=Roseimicrobium gellanilyticum TaxID=748857 RepID=A0A366HBH4_9BACT|nr:hypothetical protein [Roseimicrobium gellanilyticum]RBP39693.1 hypothetical protein DES53_109120 [Roseimicrobium gellanilyticum]